MSPNHITPQRILITGAAGAIGQTVSRYLLEQGHHVRGLDRQAVTDLADFVQADLTNHAAVRQAAAGIKTIIHLGAFRNDADFMKVLVEPNVHGLYHICDAARQQGVQRLILASTMQTVAGHGWERGSKWNRGPIRVEDGPAPRNHYALTKVWAEMMGQMYAHSYGLSVIGVRIGWFARDLATANRLAASQIGTRIYLSHGDAQRFFARCVESPTPAPGEYVTLFATSQPPTEPLLDLEPAHRIIGYAPQDTWPQGLPFDYPNPSSSI